MDTFAFHADERPLNMNTKDAATLIIRSLSDGLAGGCKRFFAIGDKRRQNARHTMATH